MKNLSWKNTRKNVPDYLIEVILILLAIIVFIPIYYLLVTTLKTPAEATTSPLGFPMNPIFDGYTSAWDKMNYPRVFLNNLIITVSAVLGIIIFGSMAAYVIARRPSRLNKTIFYIFLAGIMIPFQMGIVSLFKLVNAIHLMDNLVSVILINISGNIVVAMFLIKGFITTTIPIELEESAFMDGYGVFQTYWKIVFPLLKPVIATVAIMNSLNVWNDFMNPLLFLQSREKGVILLEVFRNIGQFSVDWTNLFPMLVLGVLPLLIFYVFTQKYIIKGIVSGALKG